MFCMIEKAFLNCLPVLSIWYSPVTVVILSLSFSAASFSFSASSDCAVLMISSVTTPAP